MDLILTELTPQELALYLEGYTWGLDEGRRECEQLRADHEHERQALWLAIYALRHDFTLNSGVITARRFPIAALQRQRSGGHCE